MLMVLTQQHRCAKMKFIHICCLTQNNSITYCSCSYKNPISEACIMRAIHMLEGLKLNYTNAGFLFYLATATNVCPKDEASFTCETSAIAFIWTVTTDVENITGCTAVKSPMPSVTDPTCGPNDEFSLSISGDGSNSTLSTQSVNENLNETRIQCQDGDVNEIICIIGQ